MARVSIPNGWNAREYQWPLWRALAGAPGAAPKRRAIALWHRRAGKDDVALNFAAVAAHREVGTYWHMLPEASQARKAIWDAVDPHTGVRRIDQAFPKELRETTREHDMFIRFKVGSTWQVLGSDNFQSQVGSPPRGIVFSEYALADPSAWAYLRPILVENGGWAVFITTTRGRNHAWRMFEMARRDPENWFAEVLTVEDTGAMPIEAIRREERELAAERGDQEAHALVRQEYYCDPDAALPGTYYAALMRRAEDEGRVGPLPWDPQVPVVTAWDLGVGDSTTIWFAQFLRGRWRVIDYYQNAGVGLDFYARVLRERPYTYARVAALLPHDARQRDIGTVDALSRVSTLASLGVKSEVLPRTSIPDRINAARQWMQTCEFNTEPVPILGFGARAAETRDDAVARMQLGIDALRQYRREWNDALRTFSDRPVHDWCSHAADAFGYLAQGAKPAYAAAERRPPGQALLD